LPALPGSSFFLARDQLLWVTLELHTKHPRVVVTSTAMPRDRPLRFIGLPRRGWFFSTAALPLDATEQFRAAAHRLCLTLHADCTTASGFGALLTGQALAFPLQGAQSHIGILSQTLARDDPRGMLEASRALIGFGTGLTPSGDDLLGGALFARRFMARRDHRWRAVAMLLTQQLRARSHPVSAALFSDLARGNGYEPLHRLAAALAVDDDETAYKTARDLCTIGHSSGWDILVGFILGTGNTFGHRCAASARASVSLTLLDSFF
jgi:hypothetical protein